MKIAWLTDIHLNFLSKRRRMQFYNKILVESPDVVLIGGDIGEADTVAKFLVEMNDYLDREIYFVLGNHDYYRSSIKQVRMNISTLSRNYKNLNWLPESGTVEINKNTALIGHGLWADGKLGDFLNSDVLLNDYIFIKDFNPSLNVSSRESISIDSYTGKGTKNRWLSMLYKLGDESAEYISKELPKALEYYSCIIFLSHVPPFKEACLHLGKVSDDNWLPHFSCKSAGDKLIEIMRKHPDKKLTVLCGHTHGSGEVDILENIKVYSGEAVYEEPQLQRIFNY